MWSHTISSKPKASATSKAGTAKTNDPTTANQTLKGDSKDGEDAEQSLDTSGPGKASRARAPKKPLTVGKAPIVGRTSSSKADQQPTTPTENVRPTLEKRTSRATPAQPVKGATPARAPRAGTPTQPASSASKARAPILAASMRTKGQAPLTPKIGTPVGGRPAVKSPKTIKPASQRTSTRNTPPKAQTATHQGEKDFGTQAEDGVEVAAGGTNHIENTEDYLSLTAETPDIAPEHYDQHLDHGDVLDRVDAKSRDDFSVKDKLQGKYETSEVHEELNREITLRNDIINSLRHELQDLKSAHERQVEGEATAAEQARALRSELDSVRSTLVDLDDTHRSTLEEHGSLLRSRDKIIQDLTQEAERLQLKLDADGQSNEQASLSFEREPQNNKLEEGLNSQNELLLARDEEIQSLSETVQDLRKQLEAVDIAKAKEIYDELLRRKDKEIAAVSDTVQDLREELEATDKPEENEGHHRLLQSKEEEVKALLARVKSLEERLEANDKAKEQEVNHSELSLRGEFQELKNKHKRKIEDLEAAAAARVEKMQADYDKLLSSTDQEIKDMAGMTQDLQKEVETARSDQKRTLDDANTKYEQLLRDAKAKFDKELHEVSIKHGQELEELRAARRNIDAEDASQLAEMTRKHAHELEAARAEQQAAETSHQQQLREVRRKHEVALEYVRHDIRNESQDEIIRLKGEIEETSKKNAHEIERTARENEQRSEENALQHKRELEEASDKYQNELADVERLRGQGSEELSEKHEKQLKSIADKYQKELDEAAQKSNDKVSRYERQLLEAEAAHKEAKAQVNLQQGELNNAQEKYEALEREKCILEEKLKESTSKHDADFKSATAKHIKDLDQATAKHGELTNLINEREQEHQQRVNILNQEIERQRGIATTATGQVASLKTTLEQVEVLHNKANDEAKLTYQQELDGLNAKNEHESQHLRVDLEAAAAELILLRNALKESDARRSLSDEEAALKHEQQLRAAGLEHDQAMARLRSEHERTLTRIAAVQADLQELNQNLSEENIRIKDASKETDFTRNEAVVEVALLNDKLELTSQDISQYQQRIAVLETEVAGLEDKLSDAAEDLESQRNEAAVEITLQNDRQELAAREWHQLKEANNALKSGIGALETQLSESSEDSNREKREAAVEISLLKDRLELVELQKQSVAEDISLSQNEANIEIALLKDKLDLSDLQSQEDKKTITALEERLHELQAQPPDTGPFVHHHLREELAMLARHHAANVEDVEALKANILAEREMREEEWRKRAQGRDFLNKEMQGLRAELNGIVGVH